MFEDSLVESQGRIRTHSRSLAVFSFLAQAALLLLLILYPLFNPQALPRQSIERLLVTPPPPRAPAPVQIRPATAPASPQPLPSLLAQLQAPRTIPSATSMTSDGGPPPASYAGSILGGVPDGLPNGIPLGPAAPTVTLAKPPAPKRPLLISSGVAAGRLITPIRPIYPEIAKAARIDGTVVVEATISRQGTIENLQVIEGPPLLRRAAIDAVAAARYRPFLLNGEPVEVQTSIRVIFSLGREEDKEF
jgi:periplasmic protein TonB